MEDLDLVEDVESDSYDSVDHCEKCVLNFLARLFLGQTLFSWLEIYLIFWNTILDNQFTRNLPGSEGKDDEVN